MMKRIGWFAVLAGLMLLCGSATAWGSEPPQVGGKLPDFSLDIPKESTERAYLGLSGSGTFKVPEIKTQSVIIEIFSMFCPYCQREAPKLNEVYEKIEADPALKGRIKLIGIGAGNSLFEVGVFKKKYGVAFPLFPDEELILHERLGSTRTPYFIALKINPDGSHRVIHSHLGAFGSVDKFLEEIVKSSELQ